MFSLKISTNDVAVNEISNAVEHVENTLKEKSSSVSRLGACVHEVEHATNNSLKIKFGVPKGLILGPLLFIC